MLQSTISDMSKKDFTTALFKQVMVLYCADMIDIDHVRELLAAELPNRTKRVKQRRSSKPKRQIRRPRTPRHQSDDLLTPFKAARVFGLAERTLANMRSAGGGPVFHKLSNRTIRYRYSDLQAFITQSVKQNTSQY